MQMGVQPTILADGDPPPVSVINAGGTAGVCLVCEHASAAIPRSLGDLGLAPEHRHSHATVDIGVDPLARELSRRLDAPLVAGGLSRLVFDCNRPPDAPDAIPEQTETIPVPGNRGLSAEDRAARVREVHDPFRAQVADTLDGFSTAPALVTIHTFTPVWHGQPREVEVGILNDADPRLAERMLAGADGSLLTLPNAPYSAVDGVTHTLRAHAVPRGLENVMIEVRNDLLQDDGGVMRVADALMVMLRAALPSGAVRA